MLRALSEPARREALGGTFLAAHEQFCISDAARDARSTAKSMWPLIGRVNTHTYDSSEFIDKAPAVVTKVQDNDRKRRALRRAAARNGKDLWVSEYGTGKGAEGLARHVMVGRLGNAGCGLHVWWGGGDLRLISTWRQVAHAGARPSLRRVGSRGRAAGRGRCSDA